MHALTVTLAVSMLCHSCQSFTLSCLCSYGASANHTCH